MRTNLMNEIAARVKQIDARVSCIVEGGMLKGTFRGKKNEDYCYIVSSREFKYNNEGPNVRKAIEQAVNELINNY